MKTYPYQTPDGIIQLVEKRELDDSLHLLLQSRIRCSEWVEVAGKHGAEIDQLRAANAELIERLRERTESHLAASARDVQTIQRQAIMLERLADALRAINSLGGDDFIQSDNVWSDASVTAFHQSLTALSAYESSNLEPVSNPIDEAVKRMEAVPWKELDLAWDYARGGFKESVNAIRTILIKAAKGDQP